MKLECARKPPLWDYANRSVDPDTTLDKVIRNDERQLCSLERDGLPEVLGIGSLKYRRHHQPLPYHIHRDAIEIHLCRAGVARFEIEGVAHTVMPGNVCLTQPGVNHHLATVLKRQEYSWLLLRVDGLKKPFLGLNRSESALLLRQLRAIGPMTFPADRALSRTFDEVEAVLSAYPRGRERTLRLRLLVLRILLQINDSTKQKSLHNTPKGVSAVIDRFRDFPNENLSMSALAELANMSESAFFDAFKKATGKTPAVYRTAQRIETAKRLLADSAKRITDIAVTLGFSSTAHFSTVFRQETGLTPSVWRIDNDLGDKSPDRSRSLRRGDEKTLTVRPSEGSTPVPANDNPACLKRAGTSACDTGTEGPATRRRPGPSPG